MKQESYGDQTKNSTARMGGGGINKNTINTTPPSPVPSNTPGPMNQNWDDKHNHPHPVGRDCDDDMMEGKGKK